MSDNMPLSDDHRTSYEDVIPVWSPDVISL